MTSPSWYDILGVSRDASPEEIKRAWRTATDHFEPGSGTGQFRLFNEAADTLLDPGKRAEYDAELDGRTAPAAPERTVPVEPEPTAGAHAAPAQGETAPAGSATAPEYVGRRRAGRRKTAEATSSSPRRRTRTRPTPVEPAAQTGVRVPWWTLVVLGVLAVALTVVGSLFAVQNHHYSQTQIAGQEASAAAEQALTTVLSYNYQHMAADRAQSLRFLTPTYKTEYTRTFDKLIQGSSSAPGGAIQTKAIVTASVQGSAVVDATPDVAHIIVFVDQKTVRDGGAPSTSYNRLVARMKRSGSQWLLDYVNSY